MKPINDFMQRVCTLMAGMRSSVSASPSLRTWRSAFRAQAIYLEGGWTLYSLVARPSTPRRTNRRSAERSVFVPEWWGDNRGIKYYKVHNSVYNIKFTQTCLGELVFVSIPDPRELFYVHLLHPDNLIRTRLFALLDMDGFPNNCDYLPPIGH